MSDWQPIDTYKKDGIMVLLLVDADVDGEDSSHPIEDALTYRTIGFNNADNVHDDDTWEFAGWDWGQDCFRNGRGTPTHWQPLPAHLSETTLNTLHEDRGRGTARISR